MTNIPQLEVVNLSTGYMGPKAPTPGQLVFDVGSNKTMVWNGAHWIAVSMHVAWHLFLDDLRQPVDAGLDGDITIARSSREAEQLVEARGLPENISFDHDLGGEDTGFKFMWWLINGHLDEKWNLAHVKRVQIHTANSIGADKLIALWTNFCRTQKIPLCLNRVWPKEPE